jgi:hypothetical protein
LRPGRTILAVLLGYLALIIFDIIGGVMLAGAVQGQRGSALIIGGEFVLFVSAILAGAVTARMAPFRPLSHAGALGLAIFCVSVLAASFTRPVPHQVYPSWYPYAAAVLGGVGAFVGGALVARSAS